MEDVEPDAEIEKLDAETTVKLKLATALELDAEIATKQVVEPDVETLVDAGYQR